MHDILRGPAASHRAGLPAFCWPPVKQAESRTGATRTPRQAHRAPQPVRTARTAPLSPDLGQPADDETGRWAVLPALWPMRAWLGVVGGVSTSAYRGPIEVERRAYPLRRQIAPHRQHHPPARRPGRIEDRPDQRSLARTAAPYARSSVPPSNNGSGRPAPRASFASRAISSLTRCPPSAPSKALRENDGGPRIRHHRQDRSRPGAAQPHTTEPEPTMHDNPRDQPTSRRAALPAFCWSTVRQAERRPERHARPDDQGHPTKRRTPRTAAHSVSCSHSPTLWDVVT